MGTFYKYAERNVQDQIDWNEVSKGFTDMLKTEVELREKKKADIEKATQETLKSLSDAPTGQDQRATDKILNFAASAKENMLMMNRLLKSGQLNPKDYTIFNQNLQQDTKQLFEIAKNYQDTYKKSMDRRPIANSVEGYFRSQIEKYANFSKSDFYINPTGRVTAGIPKKDPKTGQMVLGSDPNEYQSLDALKWASAVEIDKFDTQGSVDKIIGSLGEHTDIVFKNRILTKISDITKRTALDNPEVNAYKLAEDNFVTSALIGNPFSAQSVLTEDLGVNPKTQKPYEFTLDPKDPRLQKDNPNYGDAILLIPDPENPSSGAMVPKLTPEQFEDAKDVLKRRIRIGIDRERTGQYYEPPQEQEWKYRARQDEKKDVDAVNMVGQLYYGNPQEIDAALEYFKGLDKDIIRADRTTDGVTITYNDGTVSTIKFKGVDGKNKSLTDWIKSSTELTKIKDINQAIRKGSFANRGFSSATGSVKREAARSGDPLGEFNTFVDSNITTTVTGDEEDTVRLLRANFGKFGYLFDEEGWGDNVTITSPDRKSKTTINLSEEDAAGQIAEFMKGNADLTKVGAAIKMGATKGGKKGELD